MTWIERLKPAAYVSPGGTRLVFAYEDVSKNFEKKTSAFEFPDADGTFIQDLGHTGRRYPLRVFFHGSDHDLESDVFEALLKERGAGVLEHPLYGSVDVVPFGTITRRDDLKTASNQSIWDVTFFETVGLIYPNTQSDAVSDVTTALAAYNAGKSQEFEDESDFSSVGKRVEFINEFRRVLGEVSNILEPLAEGSVEVNNQFQAINDSIQNSIANVATDAFTIGTQTLNLIQTAARAPAEIADKFSRYGDMLSGLVTGDGATNRSNNSYQITYLFTSGAVSGSVTSSLNSEFLTRPDAIATAEALLSQFDDFIEWRDANGDFLELIDTGESYQALQEAVSLTAGYLVDIAFDLKQERRVILDRSRCVIDLCGEFYGNIENETLDFFINSNNLTGSEIYPEIKQGREIVFYL